MELLQYLTIYLNDHRAGAAAGTELAERIWRRNRSGPWANQLQEILSSVRAERETLDAVRVTLGVAGGRFRRAAALVAERASSFKPNGHIFRYSPLSRVAELEALMSGIQSKQRLWTSLELAAASLPQLTGFDFSALQGQSQAQLATLGQVHEWAARQCFIRT